MGSYTGDRAVVLVAGSPAARRLLTDAAPNVAELI
jgi:hypothetical protein